MSELWNSVEPRFHPRNESFAVLTPFLPGNLFLTCRSSDLGIHIVYALGGLGRRRSLATRQTKRHGRPLDTQDHCSRHGLLGPRPRPTGRGSQEAANSQHNRSGHQGYSSVFRQEFRHLFQVVSAVQESRVADPAVRGIVQAPASLHPTGEGSEQTPLPRLHTFQPKDISFAPAPRVATATHLGHIPEQRHRDGLALGRFLMAYCPHISWDACSRFTGYLKDHICWDLRSRWRSSPGLWNQHTGWSDLDVGIFAHLLTDFPGHSGMLSGRFHPYPRKTPFCRNPESSRVSCG